MRGFRTALEASRAVLAATSCLYFLGAQFKQVKTRNRNGRVFVWLLVALLLVSGGEAAVTIIKAHGIPDLLPLAATLLYILALLLQIDHLWPSTTEEKQPAWHAHVGSWTIMAVLDVLDMFTIIKHALEPRSSTFSLMVTSMRCCLGFALFVMFAWPDRGGHIWLGESVEDNNTTTRSNLGNSGASKRSESFAVEHTVRDMIRAAGGPWLWAKKFCIFLPWIWPSDLPGIKLYVFASLLIRLGKILLTVYTPYVNGQFVESVMQAHIDREPHLIWKPLAVLVGVRLANSGSGLAGMQGFLWEKFRLSREERANMCIHQHLMHHEATFHDTAGPVDVITASRLSETVCTALDFILLEAVPQTIIFIGALFTVLSLYGPHVALLEGFIAALNTLLLLRQNRTLMPMYDAEIMAYLDTERRRYNGLRGWRTVSLYGQADHEINTYATSLGVKLGLAWKRHLVNLLFRVFSDIAVQFGYFIATALVVFRGLSAGSTIGSLVAFSGYWDLLQDPLSFFIRIPDRITKNLYAADRLRRIMEVKPTMHFGTADLRLTGGCVEFKNITVKFPGAGGELFKRLNLVIEPGKTTAFVGPSGVGKSTLLALATRIYDPTEGIVMIDGQDIRTLKKGELPKHIAVMAQKPYLFGGTIMDNIRYGRLDATESEVYDAAKSAGLHDHIMSLPKQYDKVVGDEGGFFSGGEAQRLALARVLLHQANILILDEATSALDADTEAFIKDSIKALGLGKTTIIIAHRLSSVMHAHKIIVLEKGEDGFATVAEEGKHNELLERNGVYARLWRNHIGAVKGKDQQETFITPHSC